MLYFKLIYFHAIKKKMTETSTSNILVFSYNPLSGLIIGIALALVLFHNN